MLGCVIFELRYGINSGLDQEINSDNPYLSINLRRDVIYATTRAGNRNSLKWINFRGGAAQLSETPTSDQIAQLRGKTIIVLVHGFHGTTQTVETYFNELIDYVLSKAVGQIALVVYDWPAIGREYDKLSPSEKFEIERRIGDATGDQGLPIDQKARWEALNYIADQQRARTVGALGLQTMIRLLSDEFGGANIVVLGHSMGCFVIHSSAEMGLSGKLKGIIWLAPDVAVNEFTSAMEREKYPEAEFFSIYFSTRDAVLAYMSGYMNMGARIGQAGPNRLSTHRRPEFIDLTDRLGTEPHNLYLRVASSVPERVLSSVLRGGALSK